MIRLLGRLQVEGLFLLVFVLPRDVPSDRVVPGEGARAMRTVHPDALVALPYVGAQVRLVAVQSFAVGTLHHLFTCGERRASYITFVRAA